MNTKTGRLAGIARRLELHLILSACSAVALLCLAVLGSAPVWIWMPGLIVNIGLIISIGMQLNRIDEIIGS